MASRMGAKRIAGATKTEEVKEKDGRLTVLFLLIVGKIVFSFAASVPWVLHWKQLQYRREVNVVAVNIFVLAFLMAVEYQLMVSCLDLIGETPGYVDKELTSYDNLYAGKFKLTDDRQKMLERIKKYHNLLAIHRSEEMNEIDDDDDGITVSPVDSNDSMDDAVIILMFTVLALLMQVLLIVHTPHLGHFLAGQQFGCLLGLFAGFNAWAVFNFLVVQKKMDKFSAFNADQSLLLNGSDLPVVVFDNEKMLFADTVTVMDEVYRVNVTINPGMKRQFDEVVIKALDQNQNMAEISRLLYQLMNKPAVLKKLVAEHDPLIEKLREWYLEHQKMYQTVLNQWLDLSKENLQQLQKRLIERGDLKVMDDETSLKYFHELGKKFNK